MGATISKESDEGKIKPFRDNHCPLPVASQFTSASSDQQPDSSASTQCNLAPIKGFIHELRVAHTSGCIVQADRSCVPPSLPSIRCRQHPPSSRSISQCRNQKDQEHHLLVKVIDRVLYKLDDLVRPYVHKILVVIEPLLIDEDYYPRVEGREIISNLSKAALHHATRYQSCRLRISSRTYYPSSSRRSGCDVWCSTGETTDE